MVSHDLAANRKPQTDKTDSHKMSTITNHKDNKSNKLLWYVNRLRTMNFPEISHRVQVLVQKKYEQRTQMGYFPRNGTWTYPKPILSVPAGEGPFNVEQYPIFAWTLDLTGKIDWHGDISNGRRFPKKFAYSIDTRTEENGIAKVVWEVNRLQFLTNFCLQYRSTGEEQYLQRFMDLVRDWRQENPYLVGVNWYSNIEVCLRIITWFLCWEILETPRLCREHAAFKQFTDTIWLPLIELHGQHAYRHPSKFSSSNNHLIAEASGMFIAGAYWNFPQSKKWAKKGWEILEREIQLQHSSNGINREEASEYIQFITDFFLIAYVVGERTGHSFSTAYSSMLRKIMYYIYHLLDQSGRAPYYGDDDDGHTFVLSNGKGGNNFQSLLTTGAILFKDPVLKSKAGKLDLKNRILFGAEGATQFERLAVVERAPETKMFPEEGHFFIKKGDHKREIYLHVDAAPLGYLSIAAHGHADALSFFLHVDGIPFLADAGTYTYHSEPEWRAYFKGTLAHNTIRVDEQDQAVNGGPCLWLNHFETELAHYEDNEDEAIVRAGHSGYAHLGVTHKRTYQFLKRQDLVVITDEIIADDSKMHVYEIPFHFHPQIEIGASSPRKFALKHPGARRVELQLDDQLEPRLVKGSKEPILGWYSGSFLKKEPTHCLYSRLEKAGSFQLVTKIKIIS